MLPADIVEGLGGGDDVEGRWNGASLFEVGDPQLRPRKLPLCVRLLLKGRSIVHDWSGKKKRPDMRFDGADINNGGEISRLFKSSKKAMHFVC